ncbi:MAG: alpha-isopropylmalate synthase regulatory domain-containing protein, partial [bacterium]
RLDPKNFESAYSKFLGLADKKKQVYDDDLMMLVRDESEDSANVFVLTDLQVTTGTGETKPTATVRLTRGGKTLEGTARGDGPVDAFVKAINRLVRTNGRMSDFSLQSITVGQDAMGEANVSVTFGSETLSGKAVSTDIIEASAKAYLSCVNRYLCMKAAGRNATGK